MRPRWEHNFHHPGVLELATCLFFFSLLFHIEFCTWYFCINDMYLGVHNNPNAFGKMNILQNLMCNLITKKSKLYGKSHLLINNPFRIAPTLRKTLISQKYLAWTEKTLLHLSTHFKGPHPHLGCRSKKACSR